MAVLVWSGVVAFQRDRVPVPLAATEGAATSPVLADRPAPSFEAIQPGPAAYVEVPASSGPSVVPEIARDIAKTSTLEHASYLRSAVKLDRTGRVIMVNGKPWTGEIFDHRPIRPVYTRTMKTTAYSPDERSCGKWADGITASGKSVWMNGGRLVAADRKVPYGTILTIPGYNNGKPVQVWDRGGKIKGNRLDVLYPTHEVAMRWGVQDLPVVFWEFVEAD